MIDFIEELIMIYLLILFQPPMNSYTMPRSEYDCGENALKREADAYNNPTPVIEESTSPDRDNDCVYTKSYETHHRTLIFPITTDQLIHVLSS